MKIFKYYNLDKLYEIEDFKFFSNLNVILEIDWTKILDFFLFTMSVEQEVKKEINTGKK